MSSYDVEVRFIGQFAVAAQQKERAAWTALNLVQPGMLEQPALNQRFEILSGRFAAGEDLDDPDDVDDQTWQDISDESQPGLSELVPLAERIRTNHQAREQVRLLRLGFIAAEQAVESTNGKAKHVAERLSTALLHLFADGGDSRRPASLAEILDAEELLLDSQEEVGVTLPYPKLEAACGPWIPGDLAALPAFSGSGKSTLAANLAVRWIRRGVPVLAFPTEMRERWISRALAADSGARQWVAEKRQWRKAGDDEKARYRSAIATMRSRSLEVVNRANITPAEIIAATRILRKRWAGQTVVVIVDHMHRLNYGAEEANKAVGPATKMIKDFASDDTEGGLVFLLLYQPRKPSLDTYRPIAAYEIRGDSTVWNEIDTCISPFRAWVKTDPQLARTAWGTPGTLLAKGAPVIAKPESEGAKLTDEHVFIKIDKRRVGGEGATIVLDYDNPSGAIHEGPAQHWGSQ